MAKLKITRANGEVTEHKSKALRENEKQTDIFWLAWECLRRANVTVPTFGIEFIDTLDTVEVLDESKN